MAFDNKSIEIIVNNIKKEITGAFISMPVYLNNKEFVFPYSKEIDGKVIRGNIVFSLNSTLPYVLLTKNKISASNVNTPFLSSLKKVAYTTIGDIKKESGERIVVISLNANNNDLTETNSGYEIIIELFPNHPNFYIVALPSNKIISLYKEYTNFEKGIFIVKNTIYNHTVSEKKEVTKCSSIEEASQYFPNNLFKIICEKANNNIDEINKIINNINKSNSLYLIDNNIFPYHFDIDGAKKIDVFDIYTVLEEKNKKTVVEEKEYKLIETIKKLIQSNDKKINNLNSDYKKALNNLVYKEYGQLIYMCQSDIKPKDKVLKINDYIIDLDPKLSISENANRYFKKYQKAKTATNILTQLIESAKLESIYLKSKLIEVNSGSNRDIQELKSELLSLGYIKNQKGNNFIQKYSKNRKYLPHYLITNNIKIGYGKNGLQNEELTFKIAKDTDIFIHVKDYPGAHVIVFNDDKEESILLGCELALYLSNLDSGELMVCKKKYVKKNSLKIGLVKIKTYNSIIIKNIRRESYELFKNNL